MAITNAEKQAAYYDAECPSYGITTSVPPKPCPRPWPMPKKQARYRERHLGETFGLLDRPQPSSNLRCCVPSRLLRYRAVGVVLSGTPGMGQLFSRGPPPEPHALLVHKQMPPRAAQCRCARSF
jgi:hypothetical protein